MRTRGVGLVCWPQIGRVASYRIPQMANASGGFFVYNGAGGLSIYLVSHRGALFHTLTGGTLKCRTGGWTHGNREGDL